MSSDSERRRRHYAKQAERRRLLATKFERELPQLRSELAQAEAAGRHADAQGLRNKITYRERIIARKDGTP